MSAMETKVFAVLRNSGCNGFAFGIRKVVFNIAAGRHGFWLEGRSLILLSLVLGATRVGGGVGTAMPSFLGLTRIRHLIVAFSCCRNACQGVRS